MSAAAKTSKPCNTDPETPPNSESSKAPSVTPIMPHSDPITIISLTELLKDVVKTILATINTPHDSVPKAAEVQATNNPQPAFKAVDEVYASSSV
jgi:hypothetical protein